MSFLTLLKLSLVFVLTLLGLWIVTAPVFLYWEAHRSGQGLAVFSQSPFEFQVESGKRYRIMVATINGEHPDPNWKDIDLRVSWVGHQSRAGLELVRDEGWLQLARPEKRYGYVDAVSVGTVAATESGQVRAVVENWTVPKGAFAVYKGEASVLFVLFAVALANFGLSLLCARWVYKRFLSKPGGGVRKGDTSAVSRVA